MSNSLRWRAETHRAILTREIHPGLGHFEIDMGWASAENRPGAILDRYRRAGQQLHDKDIVATTKPDVTIRTNPSEVGPGSLHWEPILPAGYRAALGASRSTGAAFDIARMDAVPDPTHACRSSRLEYRLPSFTTTIGSRISDGTNVAIPY